MNNKIVLIIQKVVIWTEMAIQKRQGFTVSTKIIKRFDNSVSLKRTYYRNFPRDQLFGTKTNFGCNESSFVGHIMNMNNLPIYVHKNKSKQSYVWINSIFEAQNICFGSEIAGLLDHNIN